ncbi:5-formyltetrahydrofolate cyclo-ligase [Spirochaeta cellobiosiphila]|uniref:5-formyltetrahydrofolate cyclo-ligase n=1 Tax=Spirochaeta cellobiosiphila TaxID=504483 RepID=UPI0004117228|nr:5-formyltetrahydrofolate cyclo-ligase [Spirochaeta cellobiosiphila]
MKLPLKKDIRLQSKQYLETCSEKDIAQFSEYMSQTLYTTSYWKQSQHILLYLSFGKEIQTEQIRKRAWKENKTVWVPVMNNKKIDFYLINPHSKLVTNNYGIREPFEQSIKYEGEESSLMLVPGLAFSMKGERLGYGGGYYDKYFAEHSYPFTKIALVIDKLLCDTLPCEEHDHKVDLIITERQIVTCPLG